MAAELAEEGQAQRRLAYDVGCFIADAVPDLLQIVMLADGDLLAVFLGEDFIHATRKARPLQECDETRHIVAEAKAEGVKKVRCHILLDGRDLREYDVEDLYSIFGIIFGAPMLLLLGFVARNITWTWITLGAITVLFAIMLVIQFRDKIFKKKA